MDQTGCGAQRGRGTRVLPSTHRSEQEGKPQGFASELQRYNVPVWKTGNRFGLRAMCVGVRRDLRRRGRCVGGRWADDARAAAATEERAAVQGEPFSHTSREPAPLGCGPPARNVSSAGIPTEHSRPKMKPSLHSTHYALTGLLGFQATNRCFLHPSSPC